METATTPTTSTKKTTKAGPIRRLFIRIGFLSEHITDHARKQVAWQPGGGDNFWPEELRKQVMYQGCNTIKRV